MYHFETYFGGGVPGLGQGINELGSKPGAGFSTREGVSVAGKVVIIEDDPTLQVLLARWLETEGFGVVQVLHPEQALQAVQDENPDAVCLDLGLPGLDGMDLLRTLKADHPRLPVLILTADDNVERVVEAMQAGAYNYLTKPLQRTHLVTTLKNAAERSQLEKRIEALEEQSQQSSRHGIVGSSPAMHTLNNQIEQVAHANVTVLIQGESGSGKELVARALHASGPRSKKPFVALNCAAIPENLQESELFGHEKGAFTGAVQRHLGRFEQANGGTLFLDEVAELSASAQAKLLRVLQEKTFTRLGGTTEIRSDFRLLAATHKALEEEVQRGRFREDLFYRLAVFELRLPSLRERVADIPLLAQHFIAGFRDPGLGRMRLAPETLEIFLGYAWPGNVRELQNAIQRAVVLTPDDVIQPDALPPRILQAARSAAPLMVLSSMPTASPPLSPSPKEHPPAYVSTGPAPTSPPLAPTSGLPNSVIPPQAPAPAAPEPESARPLAPRSLEEMEKRIIEEALTRHRGNVSAASRELGIGRTTLYRKMKKHGIHEPEPGRVEGGNS
jgi:DNA-binding NtrC family response regulator